MYKLFLGSIAKQNFSKCLTGLGAGLNNSLSKSFKL